MAIPQYNIISHLHCITNNRYILFFALDAQNKIYLLRAYNVDSGNWLKDAFSTFTVDMNLTGNAPWTIGSRSNDNTGYFQGIIYWARIYNAYLSPAAMEEMTAFPTEIENFAYAEKTAIGLELSKSVFFIDDDQIFHSRNHHPSG